LPELRLEDAGLRRELIDGPESVVRTWLRRGASGWRIDCANDIGIDVCRAIRRVAEEERAPLGIVGEVMSWALPFLEQGAVDGVMNYWFRENVVGALKGEIPAELAVRNLELLASAYPLPGLLRSWNILGTHDTPRVRTVLGSRERVLMGFLLAFTFPGVPLVYYGDEVGLEGGEDPDNRRGMPWDPERWDHVTLERVRKLAAIRREFVALREGGYVPCPATSGAVLAFVRATRDPRDTVVVVANLGESAFEGRVFVPKCELFDALPLEDRISGGEVAKMRSGSFGLKLAASSGVVLVPQPREAAGYDFWKRAPRG
jgi:alpha-glucosidase